jgi:hypothetical protein
MNTLGWILLAVAVLLLGVVGSVIVVRNRRPKPDPVEHFYCPHCRQRLSYRRKQGGHQGACPRCRKTITFPGGPGRALPGRK